WIEAAQRKLQAEAAASHVRLEMVRARTAPLLNGENLDERTSEEAAADLWQICDSYLRLGQIVNDTRLLPGAPPPPKKSTAPAMQAPTPDSHISVIPTPPPVPYS